jgi:hypothetical protein
LPGASTNRFVGVQVRYGGFLMSQHLQVGGATKDNLADGQRQHKEK